LFIDRTERSVRSLRYVGNNEVIFMSPNTTNTTFCGIYCRRNLKRLNVTIYAHAHTTLNH